MNKLTSLVALSLVFSGCVEAPRVQNSSQNSEKSNESMQSSRNIERDSGSNLYFQNFEEGNGSRSYFKNLWNTSADFAIDPVHLGKKSLRVTCGINGEHGGTIGVDAIKPVNLATKNSFVVWVYDIQQDNTIQLKLKDSSGNLSQPLWSSNKAIPKQWAEITWPMKEVTGVDLTNIVSAELYEWNAGTYYFDSIGWK